MFEMIPKNICLLTDSYKICHHYLYPKGTQKLYSYLESRSGAKYNRTVFYGLQYIIKEYLEGQVVTQEKIDEADKLITEHIGKNVFNKSGWEYILDEYQGKLPLEIKAIPEGTPVPVGNVLMTVENTDEKSFWLVNYLEPLLLQVWYPSTVATLSAEIRKLCSFYLDITSETDANLPFMLHDFGFRGASSVESSRLAGSAHLLSFQGTDTLSSQTIPRNYYYYPGGTGYSVQATEHSVMTSLGEKGEYKQVEYILDNAYDGVISLVIDSYNYRKFLQEISTHNTRLNKKCLEYISRGFENNGIENKVVFRPDSGEPVSVTLDCLNILGEGFGTHYNKKGYKEFNTNIGLLWGDGLNYQKIRDILFNMKNNQWSSNVIIFGMGGGLHTGVNRDTQRNAFKCSAQYRNNKWYDIYKNPLDSSKKSKQGLLKLIRSNDNGEYKTVPKQVTGKDCLQTVFLDGELKSKNRWMDMRHKVGAYYG